MSEKPSISRGLDALLSIIADDVLHGTDSETDLFDYRGELCAPANSELVIDSLNRHVKKLSASHQILEADWTRFTSRPSRGVYCRLVAEGGAETLFVVTGASNSLWYQN